MQTNSSDAARDLEYIHSVMERTHQRIDPHAFHFVHWGLIVLVWYPLANWFAATDRLSWIAPLGIGALATGMLLSCGREMLLRRGPRLEGANTFIVHQVLAIVIATIGGGMVLSMFAPSTGFIEGRNMPIVWGLIYATLAFMTGVVYTREFLVSGVFIFAGTLCAMVFSDSSGYILGPVMGLGMAVPGWRAERRVQRLREEQGAGATATVR